MTRKNGLDIGKRNLGHACIEVIGFGELMKMITLEPESTHEAAVLHSEL